MGVDVQPDQTKPSGSKKLTEFAKRNPFLAKIVPDAIENAVDAVIPDNVEKVCGVPCVPRFCAL